MIGKMGAPVRNFCSFNISHDFTALAIGLQDGNIIILKSKNLLTGDI